MFYISVVNTATECHSSHYDFLPEIVNFFGPNQIQKGKRPLNSLQACEHLLWNFHSMYVAENYTSVTQYVLDIFFKRNSMLQSILAETP